MTPLLVALGGALGAVLRHVAAQLMDEEAFPTGTLVVNIAGSFLLGAFSSMVLSGSVYALMGVGFCGGLTTYSAFAVQTHRLGGAVGTAYATLTVVLSLVACSVGFAIYA